MLRTYTPESIANTLLTCMSLFYFGNSRSYLELIDIP